VGYIGDVNPLPRNKPYITAQYAMAGEMLGMRLILTDSGSGAPSPPDPKFISTVRKALSRDTIYIYAGGVKNHKQAGDLIRAGAQGIHVGTAFENARKVSEKVRKFSEAMRKEGERFV
ncbi:MAG: geranylgeranylglyceryl/heptaprenylglyceryl phosphate synthase, partial [Candidatus Aenigmatarchaeota archaeon]